MASAGLVVIGSGPAGVSAADAFRQHVAVDDNAWSDMAGLS
jgi:pyruvate/2-oxoglutarate dehydrogenase complex dihydrolipoamide dehydrogenase (E3) component